jgi:hypothetical protein
VQKIHFVAHSPKRSWCKTANLRKPTFAAQAANLHNAVRSGLVQVRLLLAQHLLATAALSLLQDDKPLRNGQFAVAKLTRVPKALLLLASQTNVTQGYSNVGFAHSLM